MVCHKVDVLNFPTSLSVIYIYIYIYRVPPNVKFLVDDVEKDWIDPRPYDYIHCRYMAASIRDWPKLLRQCYE